MPLDDKRPARSPLSDDEARALATVDPAGPEARDLRLGAAARRDRAFGRTVTFSPKVFLPITNLCRNRCDYCSFRRSPGDAGEWTMTRDEVASSLDAAHALGCSEALLCLGDKPEGAFSAYRKTLASFGHSSTVDYLVEASHAALARGLWPHTNAGVLDERDMARLRECNVSLGIMLESASERLCEPGQPHHKAPDKRPAPRLRMLDEAGKLRIPMTTGILVGIGETPLERIDALLAIRALHRRHGHIQEVIVQSFRAHPDTAMADAPEPDADTVAHTLSLARLILDDEVSVQAPPNLNPGEVARLLDAGLDDWGGVSPLTPDFINPRHPWPHLGALREACAAAGFALRPRLPVRDRFLDEPGWVDERLAGPARRERTRLQTGDAGALFGGPAPDRAAPAPPSREVRP